MNEFYTYLKRKYQLNDDDIEEYVDSFYGINQGANINAVTLKQFIYDEFEDSDWTLNECKDSIIEINRKVNAYAKSILDLRTFLLYIIPICNEYVITRVGIREIFDMLDTDQDGKITCDELISLLYRLNKQIDPDDMAAYKVQIKKMCVIADTDLDGYISYEEFKSFVLSTGIVGGTVSTAKTKRKSFKLNLNLVPQEKTRNRHRSMPANFQTNRK